jgi:hypothetical protein
MACLSLPPESQASDASECRETKQKPLLYLIPPLYHHELYHNYTIIIPPFISSPVQTPGGVLSLLPASGYRLPSPPQSLGGGKHVAP